MKQLSDLIQRSEDNLMQRILVYARERDYAKYTSTLVEAWRASVSGLSSAIIECIQRGEVDLELSPDIDYRADPAADFGIIEAQKHRSRGISFSMFLGLFKYYRQSYMDLVHDAGFDLNDSRRFRMFLERFFDRVEIAFCTEWNGNSNDALLDELRTANRALTNEKNKFLTIFESLYDPVLLLDENCRIVDINVGAARLFDETAAPGEMYYGGPESYEAGPLHGVDAQFLMPWLDPELTEFIGSDIEKTIYEKTRGSAAGAMHYQVSLSRMLDVSGKFTGVVVDLKDITRRKEYESALIKEKETSRKYLNVAGVIMLALDTAGNVTMMNRKGRKILGYEKHEILGRCWFDTCLPAEQVEHVRGVFKEIISGKLDNCEYVENSVITKSGETRTVAWYNSLLYDAQGRITGCLSSGEDITDRKQAEKSLRESAALLKSSINAMASPFAIINTDTLDIEMANDAYCGHDDIGKKCHRVSHASDTPCCCEEHPCPLSLIKQTGKPVVVEHIHVDKQGDQRNIEVYAFPMFDETGRLVRMIESSIDITERKRAEEALHKSETRLRTIYESTSDAVMLLDENGFFDCNEATLHIFGCADVPAFCACHPADLSPALQPCGTESLILANQRIVTAMENGSNRFEWVHQRADTGHVFLAEVLLSRMILNGRTVLQATVRDITERKTMERALTESLETLSTITDAAADAIIMIDEQGRVSFWNPAASRIFGYELGEIMGRDMHAILPPECMREGAKAGFMHFQKTGEGAAINNTLALEGVRKDGTVFPLELSISRIRTNAGWSAVAIVRDTTDRKETADKLKQLMAELERSNNELEQFAYVASHDLQEPLRMIASYMQLLSQRYKGKLDEKADKYIHYAVDGAERMKKQITALLAYSRINRGGRTMEPVNCNDIFKQVVINLNEAVKQGGADVTSGDLPTISADAQMLVYIFQNLIGNAVKFRNGKAPHVHVAARRDNDEWLFSVSDDGIGIDPRHQDKIFQILQRLHSKSEYEGTGIGLALVRKAVEHHKGRIWVESEPGSGATFFFTIPN